MISGLNERIRVGAVFDGNGWPRPVWFDYKGRKITIKTIFYRWREKSSGNNIVKFSLADDSVIYEIEFDLNDLNWKLIAFDESKNEELYQKSGE